MALLTPAASRIQDAADRSMQVQHNLALAFALAWYQRDHRRYPENLHALTPKYLSKVPNDVFSGKPLVYRRSETGFLLYSVGVNCRDDEGRSSEDEPPGDDLSVRLPLPELRKPGR